MLRLYGSYTSPFVRHCRIAVLESALECELIETAAADAATLSPTQKVPFLQAGDRTLTDSSSILKFLREESGSAFFPDLLDFELFCTVNTLMDAAINVFLFERYDGITPAESKYLTRQQSRVDSGLAELASQVLPASLDTTVAQPLTDGQLRLACFLAWGRFRQRFELGKHESLTRFLQLAEGYERFAVTAPPVPGPPAS